MDAFKTWFSSHAGQRTSATMASIAATGLAVCPPEADSNEKGA